MVKCLLCLMGSVRYIRGRVMIRLISISLRDVMNEITGRVFFKASVSKKSPKRRGHTI